MGSKGIIFKQGYTSSITSWNNLYFVYSRKVGETKVGLLDKNMSLSFRLSTYFLLLCLTSAKGQQSR